MDAAQSEWLCRELGYVLSAAAQEFNANRPTLRDQFAQGAMQGLLSAPHLDSWGFTPFSHDKPENVARVAYALADAMLAAREASGVPDSPIAPQCPQMASSSGPQ